MSTMERAWAELRLPAHPARCRQGEDAWSRQAVLDMSGQFDDPQVFGETLALIGITVVPGSARLDESLLPDGWWRIVFQVEGAELPDALFGVPLPG